jgi:hypothetical protein
MMFTILAQGQGTSFVIRVVDKFRVGVEGATILIVDPSKGKLTNTTTDGNGQFMLSSFAVSDSTYLLVNHLSYAQKKILYKDILDKKEIILTEENYQLQELIIKGKTINKIGDTVTYAVNKYREAQDANLEDILKKIPGITINTDGKIFHNGLQISKFYIENLDLLDGSYQVATRELNLNLIETIEVLQNHQHKLVLKNIVIPENAAINIKLKNKIATTSNIKLGFDPENLNHLFKSTTFAFKKKIQANLNLSSNNAGKSSQDLLANQYAPNDQKKSDFTFPTNLNVSTILPPPLDKHYYFDNLSNLGNISFLTSLPRENQIKVTVNYDFERLKNIGQNAQIYNFDGQSFSFLDSISHLQNTTTPSIKLVHEINAKNVFYKTDLKMTKGLKKAIGEQIFNTTNVSENLQDDFINISLISELDIKWKGKPISFKVKFDHSTTDQTLLLSPALVFDQGQEKRYNAISQNLLLTQSKLSASDFKNWKNENITYNLIYGIELLRNKFNSSAKNSIEDFGSRFINDYYTDEANVKTIHQFTYYLGKIKTNISIPILYKYIGAHRITNSQNSLSGLGFLPNISFQSGFTNLQYGYDNDILTFNTVFAEGLVINSYRNVSMGSLNFTRYQKHNITADIRLSALKNDLDNSFAITYRAIQTGIVNNRSFSTNLEAGSIVEENVTSKSIALNHITTLFINDRALRLDLSSNYIKELPQLSINNAIADASTTTGEFQLNGQYIIGQWVMSAFNSFSHIENGTNQLKIIKSQGEVFYNLKRLGKVSIRSGYVKYLDFSHNLLSDVFYKKRLEKQNIDFEIEATNLLNASNFYTQNINPIGFNRTSYNLRPRQILFHFRFLLK